MVGLVVSHDELEFRKNGADVALLVTLIVCETDAPLLWAENVNVFLSTKSGCAEAKPAAASIRRAERMGMFFKIEPPRVAFRTGRERHAGALHAACQSPKRLIHFAQFMFCIQEKSRLTSRGVKPHSGFSLIDIA